MISTWDTFRTILPWAATILGLLTAILVFLGKLRETWNNFLEPLWKKVLRPLLKVVVAAATLILPNALIIGFLMHRVATYYFEAGSLDFVITNTRVFLTLIAWQTGLVSLYSFLWTILVYPRIRSWFIPWRPKAITISKPRNGTNLTEGESVTAARSLDEGLPK